MGTRGCAGFRVSEKDKLQYIQFDTYPTGVGASILDFIQKTPNDQLKEIATRIKVVSDNTRPTKKQLEECKDYYNKDVGYDGTDKPNWYQALREAQGNLTAYKNGLRYMLGAESFMNESLHCEWAYVVNVDEGVLEIYRGFNHNKNAEGRYANCKPYIAGAMTLKKEDGTKEEFPSSHYYGVALLKTLTFEEVRGITNIGEWCSSFEEWCNKIDEVGD
jgi:hypothetical protein